MSQYKEIIAGNARSTTVTEVVVTVDENNIRQAAEVATTVIMQKFGESLGASRNEVLEVNEIGLRVSLMKAIEAEATTPKGALVPVYFDSMTNGLRTKIGRTVVTTVLDCSQVVLPEHYRLTVTKMKAAGVTFVNPHKPTLEESRTLALGRETIDDVECITGNFADIDIASLVRRGLIQIETESNNILRRLAGELALNYGELDELLDEYFIAATKVALS
jgi:hypothetical protein